MYGEDRVGNSGRWENDELSALRYAIGYFKPMAIGFGIEDLRQSEEFRLITTDLFKESGRHNCYLEPAMVQFIHTVRRSTGVVTSNTERQYYTYAVAETSDGELLAFVKSADIESKDKHAYACPIYMDADGCPGIIDDEDSIALNGKSIKAMLKDYSKKYILPQSQILTYIEVWPAVEELVDPLMEQINEYDEKHGL